MGVQASVIADLVASTLSDQHVGSWVNAMPTWQNYQALPFLFKKKRVWFTSGRSITKRIVFDENYQARMGGLFQKVSIDVPDLIYDMSLEWKYPETSWAYDEREDEMNSGREAIISLKGVREATSDQSLANLLEKQAWGAPPAVDDTKSLNGFFYHIVYNATEGFTGGLPGSHTSVMGLDPTAAHTKGKWKNWSFNFTNVTKDDAVKKTRTAIHKTQFKNPIRTPNAEIPEPDCVIFTNWANQQEMELIGEAQNENLGWQLDRGSGMISFKNCPIVVANVLDDNAVRTDPLIGVNFAHLKIAIMKNRWMRRHRPIQAPMAPNSYYVYTDVQCNIWNDQRRHQWIGAKG